MRKLDLSKYEGHTKAPWKIKNTETKFSFSKGWKEIEPRVVMSSFYNVCKSDGDYTECGVRIKEPDANLIEDAPFLLNRIKTLESMLEWREIEKDLPIKNIPILLKNENQYMNTGGDWSCNRYQTGWLIDNGVNLYLSIIGSSETHGITAYTHWKYVDPFDPYD